MKLNEKGMNRMDTMELLKARRGSVALAGFMVFFTVMCLFLFVVMAMETSKPPESYLDDNSFFGVMLLFSLGGIVFFAFVVKTSVKQILAINKELKTRDDFEDVKAVYKADSKFNIKIYAIVAAVILLVIIIGKSCSAGGGGSSGGCRNCGRDKTLVPGYGYCYDCFDGYLDWEKRNNK